MTDRDNDAASLPGHAGKPSEIEAPTDIYFSTPIGGFLAGLAEKAGLTPTQVTIIGAVVGVAGGALLYSEGLGLVGVALLIAHGLIDSADGQLARRTGQVSELGRVLDGVAGYLTHAAMFIAIGLGHMHRGGSSLILISMFLAGIASIIHAQFYDHHRTVYGAIVRQGRVRRNEPAKVSGWLRGPYEWYSAMQRLLIESHAEVEAAVQTRAAGEIVSAEDRQRYRARFRRLVRGWNWLGDNPRRYATAVFVCIGRPDLLFAFILVPMNLTCLALWLWQRRADREFLAGR